MYMYNMHMSMSVCTFLCSLQETYEAKRQEHLREMQQKEERMRQMFVQKVSQYIHVYMCRYLA